MVVTVNPITFRAPEETGNLFLPGQCLAEKPKKHLSAGDLCIGPGDSSPSHFLPGVSNKSSEGVAIGDRTAGGHTLI